MYEAGISLLGYSERIELFLLNNKASIKIKIANKHGLAICINNYFYWFLGISFIL